MEIARGGKGRGFSWERVDGVLKVSDDSGFTFFEEASASGPALAAAEAEVRSHVLLAWWRFRKKLGPWRAPAGQAQTLPDGRLSFPDRHGEPLMEARESSVVPGTLEGEVRTAAGTPGWLRWRIRARPGERFLGFGERFNSVDQTGNRPFVWTEEGAYGLGERLSPLLEGVSWNPFPNGPTTAYKPIPFFISSSGYGLLLETWARVEYDVAATDPDVLEIVVWDNAFRWVLFYGPTPAEIIERMTERTGRATVPTPWTFAPWNDAVGGSFEVRRVAEKLRSEKIPTTALWSEDWQGGYWLPPWRKRTSFYFIFPFRYEVDRRLYPDAEAVASELHDDGFRWLSYFFPYILKRSPEYREAEERGFLLRNGKGGVQTVFVLWHPYGHIDLTNSDAREWYMEKMKRNLDLGFDGWMADFSEYVPPGSVACSGEPGLLHHNRFPLLWQQMNRELLDRERPDGDYVFFCRSAATGSQAQAPVFWSGDSNTDFERYDGLPSNLPAVLSAGLSGLPFWAADIGGYVVATRGRDKELFFRWTEFAALLSVMRTHHGTKPGRCWAFDSDDETLAMFARYTRLHTALFPYIYGLASEAALTGLPAVRHLILHYPADPESWGVEDEFLLGDRLLVAPVIERSARSRSVYFPPGSWVDYWTGRRYGGGRRAAVRSPLDHLPLFVKEPSIVPTLDLAVDTLAPVPEEAGLIGYEQALGTVRLTLYGEGEDRVILWDGTEVHMWRAPEADAGAMRGAVARLHEGELLERTPDDALQPEGARSAPLFRMSVRGDLVDATVTGGGGVRLGGATYASDAARERITFEWR